MWGIHDGMGWWMVFGGFWSMAFWAIAIWSVYWAVNKLATPRDQRPHAPDPLEIAKQRLARGEITREEFEELRKVLQ